MPHHGIHTIPAYMLPIDKPLKLDPKRRRRKVSDNGDSSDAEEIDDSGAVVNKEAFAPVTATNTPASSARSSQAPNLTPNLAADMKTAGRQPLRVFNQKVMGVLLQAQEKNKPFY